MAKKLLKRMAKTTGTTVGEAQGIMKQVRSKVRSGDTHAAEVQVYGALRGGPRAGVKATPARKAKAYKASKKIVKRISTRQAAGRKVAPGRKTS